MLSEVYGDRMASSSSSGGGGGDESFPLQQKLLVCCLLLLIRNGKTKEVVLGKVSPAPPRPPAGSSPLPPSDTDGAFVCACFPQLHEAYSRLCARRQVSAVGQAECLSLCSLLESRGVFALKKAKEARLTKVRGRGRGSWGRGHGGGATVLM